MLSLFHFFFYIFFVTISISFDGTHCFSSVQWDETAKSVAKFVLLQSNIISVGPYGHNFDKANRNTKNNPLPVMSRKF